MCFRFGAQNPLVNMNESDEKSTKQWVSDELVSILRKGKKYSKPNSPRTVQYVIGLAKQSSSPGELMNSILELDSSCPITETRLFSVELFRRVTGKKVFSSVNGCSSDYHQKRKNCADYDREDRSNYHQKRKNYADDDREDRNNYHQKRKNYADDDREDRSNYHQKRKNNADDDRRRRRRYHEEDEEEVIDEIGHGCKKASRWKSEIEALREASRAERSNVVVGGEKRDLGESGNGRRRRRYHKEEEEEEEEFQRKLEKLIDEIEATKWTDSRLDYRSAKYMELKGLIGSKRGDRRKGMNEVKKILNKDGFMDSYDPREDDNDIFDGKLEKAIHVYDHYYNHGKGKGIIDSETLENLTDDRRTCHNEKHMHALDKKLRMGYYANGNDVPSPESVREFILRTNFF